MRHGDTSDALAETGVSVLICAFPERDDISGALASVEAQEAPGVPREVIVVAATPPPRLPEHVRLVTCSSRAPGAIRQAGLDAARGAWLAWCDAGDAWTPDHLARLVERARAEPNAAIVYASDDPEPFTLERLRRHNVVHASEAMARAGTVRAAGGFDTTLPAGEVWDLWLRVAEYEPVARVRGAFTVRAPRSADGRHPRIADQANFRARMAAARATHMLARERGLIPFNPATWDGERRELLLQATFGEASSFGLVARELALALERRGVEVTIGPLAIKPEPGWERFYRKRDSQDCLGLYYDFRVGPAMLRTERLVRYTMWESTQAPRDQIDETNATCALVYVPCRQNADAYRASGLRVPIKVLRHGVNPQRFPMLARERTGAEPFTFGAIGAFSPRKGIDVLLRAFEDEFGPREAVRLLLKTGGPGHGLRPRDPRVTLIERFYNHAELLELMRSLDAFVFPSRGEGFGLPGLEAMATGLPVIATNWSGPADYLDPADSLPLDYELVNPGGVTVHVARFWGRWAEPSYEHLRQLLRWLYEHPEQAAGMGRRAAARVRSAWTWDGPADQLRADLDALARGVTPV